MGVIVGTAGQQAIGSADGIAGQQLTLVSEGMFNFTGLYPGIRLVTAFGPRYASRSIPARGST